MKPTLSARGRLRDVLRLASAADRVLLAIALGAR